MGIMDECKPEELLRGLKIRVTSQRLLVIGQLIHCEKAISAYQLHDALSQSIDLATVYRILSHFKEKGLVREIRSIGGTGFYELACKHHPVHPHFRCERCDDLICLDDLDFDKALDSLSLKNISINAITLSGCCENCL